MDRLGQRCGGNLSAHVLRNPSRIPGLAFDDVLTFEIELSDEFATKPALREIGRTVSQSDFPRILERIRSEVLEEFAGGPGQLGLHGTNDPDTLGTQVSSGCIRLHNDEISRLVLEVGLPLGTPVEVIS